MAALHTAKSVVTVAKEKQLNVKAASLAYFAVASFIPFVLLLIIALSKWGGDGFAAFVIDSVLSRVLPAQSGQLREMVMNAAGRSRATALSGIVLFWSSLRLFRGLDAVFVEMYGDREKHGIGDRIVNILLAFLTVTGALALLLVVGVALAINFDAAFWRYLAPLLLVPGLTLVFLPMFRIFPKGTVPLREALPGALISATSWALLFAGFRLYITTIGQSRLYSFAGLALIVLTWLYLGGIGLLLGVVYNAVTNGHVKPERPPSFL
ncbi:MULTISPECIES: YihY/virulence factor BrkB family protein [unclassified Haladaptatus]|uniref:YihY/virulence factor BrkB family protein n=1 Tax=unclassified Haladaptatus TaxID=2622732 RepID=UPI0023E8C26C|nr:MULTISPECIES: YihY/virulence factor BrkB family protein [unclassified Haladaptatus]